VVIVKVYLSSYRIGTNPDALVALVNEPRRAALVFNARDVYPDRSRHFARDFEDLLALGFRCEELDLRSYFDDFDGLSKRLSNVELVWAVGGNSFALARAMTLCRFGEALHGPLSNETLAYGGYSAGTCVATPDLEGINLMDEPDARADGHPENTLERTLGLVPWRIVPHWRSDHPESALAEIAVEYLLQSGLAFQTLRDGQALVVTDHASQVM
jgi:dipeptidase E